MLSFSNNFLEVRGLRYRNGKRMVAFLKTHHLCYHIYKSLGGYGIS